MLHVPPLSVHHQHRRSWKHSKVTQANVSQFLTARAGRKLDLSETLPLSCSPQKHLRDHTPTATHAHQSPAPRSPLREDAGCFPPRKLVRATHLIPGWSLPSSRPRGVARGPPTHAARRILARNIRRVHWVPPSVRRTRGMDEIFDRYTEAINKNKFSVFVFWRGLW